jgi:hypothetical protein
MNPSSYRNIFSRKETVYLLVIFLLGCALRLHNLGSHGLWPDEIFTMEVASDKWDYDPGPDPVGLGPEIDVNTIREDYTKRPYFQPVTVIHNTHHYEMSHPPLYYITVNLFLAAFGVSEFVVRIPSAVFGSLTIPFLFLLGRRLHGSSLGLMGAAIFAFSPFQIYYAQAARMYSLVVFLAVVSTWLLVDLSFRRREGRNWSSWPLWLTYIGVSTAGIYTQYIYVFIFGVHLAYVIVRHSHDRKFLARWFLGIGISFFIFLPWLLTTLRIGRDPMGGVNWLVGRWPIIKMIKSTVYGLMGFVWVHTLLPVKFLWFWFILTAIGVISVWNKRELWILPFWLVFSPICFVLIDIVLGTHASSQDRYLIMSAPPLYLLLGLALIRMPKGAVAFLLAGAVFVQLMIGGYWTSEGKIRKHLEYKEAATEINATSQNENLLIMVSRHKEQPLTMAYYLLKPETIETIYTSDINKIDLSPLSQREESSKNVTIVVTYDQKLFDPQSVLRQFPSLKLVAVRPYKGLYVFRFRRETI